MTLIRLAAAGVAAVGGAAIAMAMPVPDHRPALDQAPLVHTATKACQCPGAPSLSVASMTDLLKAGARTPISSEASAPPRAS